MSDNLVSKPFNNFHFQNKSLLLSNLGSSYITLVLGCQNLFHIALVLKSLIPLGFNYYHISIGS